MKKHLVNKVLMGVTIGSMLTLTACGTQSKTANAKGSGSGQPASITIEAGQALKTNNPYLFDQKNISEFEKKYNAKVNVVLDPDNQGKNILQTKLSTNEPPDIIVYNKVSAENELNVAKNMTDLSNEPWVKRLVNPDQLKSPDGKIYGFVMQQPIDAQGIVYNKEIFDQLHLSVPTSYDEFLDVCKKIKAAGITPIYAPFNDLWTFQIWASSAFGVAANENPSIVKNLNSNKAKWADQKEFEDILTKALNLYKEGYIGKSALSDTYNMAPDVFSKKQAAMMIMGDWFISDMAKKDPNLKLDLFPIPAFNGKELTISQAQLAGMFYVPKNAKNATVAKEYINFISQKKQIDQAQSDMSFLPSVKDASAPKLTPIQQEIYDKYVKTHKAVVEMNAYLKVDTTDLWKDYQDMFAGSKTPHDVLKAWDQKFDELMKAAKQPGF